MLKMGSREFYINIGGCVQWEMGTEGWLDPTHREVGQSNRLESQTEY